MGRGDHLGEFEELVLLSILALENDEAYGMRIRDELRETAGRDVAVPTVYSALDRLESKGLVTSELGEPTPERGGRAKKLFRVEPAGIEALRASRARLERLWAAASLEPDPEAP